MPRTVEGLNMVKLQETIQWRGMVRLHMLNEDDESLLSDCEWPKKSGKFFYACAATGLLFEKQTGRCLQAPTVELLLPSVEKIERKRGMFAKWLGERHRAVANAMRGKPGPKPKSAEQAPIDDENY